MLLNIEKILLKCKWKVISILSSIRGQEFTNSFLLQLSAYIKVSTFKDQILDDNQSCYYFNSKIVILKSKIKITISNLDFRIIIPHLFADIRVSMFNDQNLKCQSIQFFNSKIVILKSKIKIIQY